MGEKTNDDELRAMINEFDKNGDGESNLHKILRVTFIRLISYLFYFIAVDFEEFVAIMQED